MAVDVVNYDRALGSSLARRFEINSAMSKRSPTGIGEDIALLEGERPIRLAG